MSPRRKIIIKIISCIALVTGGVLLGIGSAGTATPLIISGIILIMVGGTGSIMASMEQVSLRPISRNVSSPPPPG